MKKRHLLSTLVLGSAAALALVGCSADTGNAGNGGGEAGKDITIGVFNGWPEGEAVSYLWKLALEDKGYNVDLEYADAGPVFQGVAGGDYDVALDGWLPLTHAAYFDEFGDDIVDLGSWNDDAKLTIAVNADAPVDSLADLAAASDQFGGRLIGIEPGAGLTKATQENVIPTYGLEGMDYITSSTPAMLAELSSKLDAGENVAVTLWRPHWAYDAYDIKDLADPDGTLGDAESIHTFTRTGFDTDFPEVSAWLKDFRMDSDMLFSLENVMYNTDEDITDYTDIVRQWMTENKEWVDSLTV
ncbi:glycine betaine ABC transporter substrate-binding protein [Microbacterium sp. TNHR37B]|uniref:glycine betaine ABC transporter substrate-binding protein n=1 Tax=Microbacterium sp. TNHR37B TaxID=1775956 RepID=UPI0007B178F8|nr:glycine betaine ABC transporter substrate-binding protein [Microbacterium sp. TNHR37B]KZE89654.1 Glycine betaine-binding protein OpuAC [Microbacterium sp. TNHR37B]